MAHNPPQGFHRLPGSERSVPASARQIKPAETQEQLEVSVYLRDPSTSSSTHESAAHAQKLGPRMSRDEYLTQHRASADDIVAIERFAQHYHLDIVETDVAARKIVLTGTVANLTAAFATELHHYEHAGQTFRGRTGYLHVPEALANIVVGVFGLDNRPQARSYARLAADQSPTTSYTPPQVAQFYNFPANLDGSGQCIALIELGGGYRQTDLTTYFTQLGLPQPQVVSISVDKGKNAPTGDANSADGEVALDIEVAGAVAPQAQIAVYFAPNTDRGFLDAINKAIHDTIHKPSVISISWGGPEASWTSQAMTTMDQAFQAAATLGITVCCAAGDNGSSDGLTDQKAHVDFPASSTYALACGGTRLEGANNQVSSETVWNDGSNGGATGGGISDTFALPTWQADAHIPPSANDQHSGRGVPDVAGNADPQTGYQVLVDGQSFPIGGTSAVAPLWAGLIALLNQKRGQAVGYLNPFLYQHYQQLTQANALRDITSGNNGVYSAGPGWDACTGLGSPDGAQLLQALLSSNQ